MNDTIDFQMVTQSIATTVEPSLRVVEHISPSWNFIVILIAMLLMVLNKQLYTMRFRMMLSFFTQPSDKERMMREKNPVVSINGITIFVSYIATLALIVQKIVVIYSENTILYNNFGFYIDICVFIAAVCILQYLFVSLYGWLFGIESATTHQEVTLLSIMTILNIVMIAFGLIIVCYPSKFILIITTSIVLIITVIRIIKTFFEFQMLSRMNILNIFLYFCIIEILPIAVSVVMVRRLIVTDCVL